MTPADGATEVLLDNLTSISATFSERMDPATLDATTFTLTAGSPAMAVSGSVTYTDSTAVFVPSAPLADDVEYAATITVGASSASGVALVALNAWHFTTGTMGVPIDLGTAGNYVILSKAGITTDPASTITGDIAVSPAAATYIVGFALAADLSNTFSTSTQVTGKVYAADYAIPTPATLITAVLDMQQAYTAAAARVVEFPDVGAGSIGGMTLGPGVYHWAAALAIPTSITLAGRASDVWIFQVDGALGLTAAARVTLTGGALAKHVFWQVKAATTLGAGAHLEGIVLAKADVTLDAGAGITGRLLVQTAVTLAGSPIAAPPP